MSTNQQAMLLATRPEPGPEPRPEPRSGPRIDSNGYCSFGYYHGIPLTNTHGPVHGSHGLPGIGTPAPVPRQNLIPNSSPGTDMTQNTTHPYSSSDISDAVQHILDQHRGCVVSDAELIRLVQKRLIIRHGSLIGDGLLTDYERTIMCTKNPRKHHKRSVSRAAEYNDPHNHAYGLKVSIRWDRSA